MMFWVDKLVRTIIEKVLFGSEKPMILGEQYVVKLVDQVFKLGFLKAINPLSLLTMGFAYKIGLVYEGWKSNKLAAEITRYLDCLID